MYLLPEVVYGSRDRKWPVLLELGGKWMCAYIDTQKEAGGGVSPKAHYPTETLKKKRSPHRRVDHLKTDNERFHPHQGNQKFPGNGSLSILKMPTYKTSF